jgi:site-specific recombinase XerC
MEVSSALTTVTAQEIETSPRDLVSLWHDQLKLDVKSGQLSADTATTYRRGFAKFQSWGSSQNHTTDTVTRNLVKAWLADLKAEGKSVATISLWLSSVRAFFQWAISEGYAAVDPTTGVKAGKRNGANRSHKRDKLTDGEMLRVLSLPDLSKRDKAILHLFAFTAARGIELHRAQMRDLSTRGEYLSLNVQGKGRDEADESLIVADKSADAALRDWIAERGTADGALFTTRYGGETHAISRRQLRGIVKGAFRRAGVVETASRRKTTHSIRHSALSKALEKSSDIRAVQRLARHASMLTTEIYMHEAERVTNAAERFIGYGE